MEQLHTLPFVVDASIAACDVYDTHTLNDIHIEGVYDSQALVRTSTDKGVTIVAFRGSETLTDWLINLMRWRTRFLYVPKQCETHCGFLKQYTALREELFASIHASIRSTNLVVATGHSLGGALATMFAVELAASMPDLRVRCYPFACPRVGDSEFVNLTTQLANLDIWRIGMHKDVLMYIPYFGYQHTTNVITLPPPTWVWWFYIRTKHSMTLIRSLIEQTVTHAELAMG